MGKHLRAEELIGIREESAVNSGCGDMRLCPGVIIYVNQQVSDLHWTYLSEINFCPS